MSRYPLAPARRPETRKAGTCRSPGQVPASRVAPWLGSLWTGVQRDPVSGVIGV